MNRYKLEAGVPDDHRGAEQVLFGTNKIVCGSTRPCRVSVTQPTLSRTQEADAPISFS